MTPGLVAALRAVVPVEPQQPAPPHADALTDRFENGPVVRLGRSPFAGHHPAHLPTARAA